MQETRRSPQPTASRRAHLIVLVALELVMAVQLAVLALRGDVPQAVFVAAIMAVMAAPSVLRRHLPVEIPSEVEAVAVLFVFATLFLGEIHDYYQRFWWWDMTLHTGSGLLLGMLGFMIVYVLNEDRHVDMHMRPAFVALFAFFFAVGLGAIWEIFEFAMDRWFGTDMQPAVPGDASGLTDTIHDLIVDTVGALVVSLLGWRYLARSRTSPIDNWAKRFIDRNPRLFGD
jgi:VanZ family protein